MQRNIRKLKKIYTSVSFINSAQQITFRAQHHIFVCEVALPQPLRRNTDFNVVTASAAENVMLALPGTQEKNQTPTPFYLYNVYQKYVSIKNNRF